MLRSASIPGGYSLVEGGLRGLPNNSEKKDLDFIPSPYLTGCMCDKLETIPVYGKEKRLGGSLILLSAW